MKAQRLNKNRVLGKLCERGHRYAHKTPDGHGILIVRAIVNQSVRYKGCGTCCTCNAVSVKDRKIQQEEYRNKPKNKKKMKKYQQDYRKTKRRKNEKKYHSNYYLTVTKPKREKEREKEKRQINFDFNETIRKRSGRIL